MGKHNVHPFRTPFCSSITLTASENLLTNIYRTPVSGVFRRKNSGFAVCGGKPASVSQFVTGIRHGRSFKQEHRNRRPTSNDAKLEQRHNHLTNETSHLKMSAAAVDDESCQDNEKHNCGGDRSPVIFAPPWVGPPAVVAAGRTASIFKVWVYHFRVPR
jgi:hypothetical protein